MKKKMKMRSTKQTAKKKVTKPIAATAIPKDLRHLVIRKFRTKDRTKRIVVLRLSNDAGYRVSALVRGVETTVRTFDVPTGSEIPTPVWLSVQRQTASWFAGHLARKLQPPSQRQERSRRKRYTKKALANFNAHLAIKATLRVVRGEVKPTQARGPLKMLVPYLCFYDPKERLPTKTTFTIHSATCSKLDAIRKKVILKRDGDSWVIEARTPDEACGLQLKEFEEDDMGYDATDFSIHDCAKVQKRVMGKTVLGRVSNKGARR